MDGERHLEPMESVLLAQLDDEVFLSDINNSQTAQFEP